MRQIRGHLQFSVSCSWQLIQPPWGLQDAHNTSLQWNLRTTLVIPVNGTLFTHLDKWYIHFPTTQVVAVNSFMLKYTPQNLLTGCLFPICAVCTPNFWGVGGSHTSIASLFKNLWSLIFAFHVLFSAWKSLSLHTGCNYSKSSRLHAQTWVTTLCLKYSTKDWLSILNWYISFQAFWIGTFHFGSSSKAAVQSPLHSRS